MEVIYPRCAGADVHKKTVVVCVVIPDEQGGEMYYTPDHYQTFIPLQ